MEEANQARDALDGTDGAQLVGGAGQSGGSDSWLAQHSEGLEVVSTRGAEEIGHTVIHIDWASLKTYSIRCSMKCEICKTGSTPVGKN